MAVIKRKPTSPGVRHRSDVRGEKTITKSDPERSLITGSVRQHSGRNQKGKITVRHKGGGEKQLRRHIDFKRKKHNILGKVVAIEYDPLRRANLARIYYADGEKRYIIAPVSLKVGD